MYEGGCCCSGVRYRVMSDPMFVHCCHCRWCQRETGSAFAVNALIETERVVLLQGEVDVHVAPTQSGSGQRIARCPECRVALFSHYAYAGIGDAVRFLRVSTLDDPDVMPPNIHIFTDSKQDWVTLDAGIPQMAEFYSASKLWPPASLARRKALFAAKDEASTQGEE